MSLNDVLAYLALWSVIGAVLFFGFVVFVFRSGLIYTARNQDGSLKQHIPLSGRLLMASLLACILVFLVCANSISLNRRTDPVGPGTLFGLNVGVCFILFAFDTFVIDALVLGRWRPAFLRLPDSLGREAMRRHIWQSLPVGSAASLVIAAIATLISISFVGLP